MGKKKQRTEGAAKRDLAKFCAFWAVVISAILFLLQMIFNLVGEGLGTVGHVMGIIAAVMLGIAIVFPAYSYACSKGKTWRIICIIIFVVYFILAILGGASPMF